jgi:hypothetical protein
MLRFTLTMWMGDGTTRRERFVFESTARRYVGMTAGVVAYRIWSK